MSRLSAAAFAALVVATVGAFFVTQHLKVADPLINGSPRPDPPAINPLYGRVCRDLAGRMVSFRRTSLNFLLQARSDSVGVYVVDPSDDIVSTITPGRYMRVNQRSTFTWDGRYGNGRGGVVPDGTYYFRVALQHENRTFTLTNIPVKVITTPPRPTVTSVTVAGRRPSQGPVIVSGAQPVTVHFKAAPYKSTRVEIYRTDLPGRPRLVFSFGAKGAKGVAIWNGRIHGAPAPAGTYLVGLAVTDQACNQGSFPIAFPPPRGSALHAGVTVRYLAAEPPLTPVPAGSSATVLVDSRQHPYTWTLRRSGTPKVLAHGHESAGRYELHVHLPAPGAGLYTLVLRSGTHVTAVPLVANATGRAPHSHVLVVLPALSWVGSDPVDDAGSGIPATLSAGDRIVVNRPLVSGLPRGFAQQLALLSYLDRHHVSYQLTTDLALAGGAGPRLGSHSGVVLDGSLSWLPSNLVGQLSGFARNGGAVLALGVNSLQAEAPLSTAPGNLTAGPARSLSPDPFGARHGPVIGTRGALITVLQDQLRLFGSTVAFPGYRTSQTITPPAGAAASLAGVGTGAATIVAFRTGRGTVAEIGLPNYTSSLANNVDAQELLGRIWKLLSR